MHFDIDRYFPDETYETGDAGQASFAEKRPLYLAASKHFLHHYREEIKKVHRNGGGGAEVVRLITTMTDTLIAKLFSSITGDVLDLGRNGGQLTLVAVGGYGRTKTAPVMPAARSTAGRGAQITAWCASSGMNDSGAGT